MICVVPVGHATSLVGMKCQWSEERERRYVEGHMTLKQLFWYFENIQHICTKLLMRTRSLLLKLLYFFYLSYCMFFLINTLWVYTYRRYETGLDLPTIRNLDTCLLISSIIEKEKENNCTKILIHFH